MEYEISNEKFQSEESKKTEHQKLARTSSINGNLVMPSEVPSQETHFNLTVNSDDPCVSNTEQRTTTLRSKLKVTETEKCKSLSSINCHALDRLGVNEALVRNGKGLLRLGICDTDLQKSEELRRYSGIIYQANKCTFPKIENLLGYLESQLHRAKGLKVLGTTEQEIYDEYSKKLSQLGSIEPHMYSGKPSQHHTLFKIY